MPDGQQRKTKRQETAAAPPALGTPKAAILQKKQTTPTAPKARGDSATTSFSSVVPATPGTIVSLAADPAAKHKQSLGQGPVTPKSKKQEQKKADQTGHAERTQQPATLPLEPHAVVLSELQPKYAVRVLSVISSTRMEKRIKAVLDQLGSLPTSHQTGGEPKPSPSSTGVALLHARASEASKLVSIVEIVKRRIREGYFNNAASAPEAAGEGQGGGSKASGKKKQKRKRKPSASPQEAIAWVQYNRIYDVETAAKKPKPTAAQAQLPPPTDQGDDAHAADANDGNGDNEDDGFEPMMHRFEAALGGKGAKHTVTTTFMSIVLSRVPIAELQRNPDYSAQSSADAQEIAHERWMANA